VSEKIRAVLVGCGGMSAAWLKAAEQIEAVQIVGLVDLVPENAAKRQEEFGLEGARTGTDMAEMLDATKPDAVFDCTVPEAHTQTAITALERGCHVLGEKPLADSMDNARRAVAAAEKAQRIYAVIQNRRYDPNIRRLRRLLDSGAIGPLTTANSDFYIGAHFGGFRDRMEHVLLLDMAIHSFDAARLVTGADPVSVYCREWNPAGSWYDHDASAIAIFEMSGGIVYTYRGSWCAEGMHTAWECDWRLIGQQGTLLWDGGTDIRGEAISKNEGFQYDKKPVEPLGPAPEDRIGGHLGLMQEFVRCIQDGSLPETNCADNIKSLSMVFGAIESAKRGVPVAVADL
jgi:predicted dehydrogenase